MPRAHSAPAHCRTANGESRKHPSPVRGKAPQSRREYQESLGSRGSGLKRCAHTNVHTAQVVVLSSCLWSVCALSRINKSDRIGRNRAARTDLPADHPQLCRMPGYDAFMDRLACVETEQRRRLPSPLTPIQASFLQEQKGSEIRTEPRFLRLYLI